jgi:hypothetical protein
VRGEGGRGSRKTGQLFKLKVFLQKTGKRQMTLEEIDQTLPNGFHDATIAEITHDYIHAMLKFKIDVLVGMPDDPVADRSRYRQAELLFSSVLFCIIEQPDFESAFRHPGDLWFLFDRMEPQAVSESLAKTIASQTLCYSFFILDWHSHIHVAAANVEMNWLN